MITKIESYLTDYLEENDDIEVILYGVEVLGEAILTVVVLGILGMITDRFQETVIFIICSILGIGTLGGYHCNTLKRCIALTIFLWFITIAFLNPFIKIVEQIGIGKLEVILLIFVIIMAPAEHINKPLTKSLKKKLKMLAVCECFVTILIITLLCDTNQKLAGTLLINVTEVVISMIVGKGVNSYVKRKDGESSDPGIKINS